MAFKKLIQCPKCKFTNRLGDVKCIICKTALPKQARRVEPKKEKEEKRKARETRRLNIDPKAATAPSPRRSHDAKDTGGVPIMPSAKEDLGESTSKTIAWICCDPLPPIPLGSKPLLTIGRDEKSDLVLPHKEVSRLHAVVKVRGRSMIAFDDEGSSNGSFLNGKRISSAVLKVGDVISLGPYEIELCSNKTMQEKMEREKGADTTRNMELTSISRAAPGAAMTGLLHEVPLSEVLQGIEFNSKTGTLSVLSGRRRGKLVIASGKPVFASLGGLKDNKAVLRMLTFTQGRFTFRGEVEPGEQTMSITLTGLLLEASRQIDEGSEEKVPT